jgi:hypothetical protein
MCITFANDGKTKVRWAGTIGWRAWKWTNANNTPPKGSQYHVQDLDKMNVKSPCLKASKKYSGNGCA